MTHHDLPWLVGVVVVLVVVVEIRSHTGQAVVLFCYVYK